MAGLLSLYDERRNSLLGAKPNSIAGLLGNVAPRESLATMAQQYISALPQQIATNQAAMDRAIGGWNKTDFGTGHPNPNYYPQAISELTQLMPNFSGTIKNVLPNDYHTLNTMVTKAYDDLLKNPNSKEFYEQYMSLRKARDVAPVNNPSNIKQTTQAVADDYRGQHQAPMRDSGKPLYDLTDVYPDDFYSSKAVQYYGTGDPSDYKVINQLQYLKNKPNEPVWMYRAVPKDAPSEINKGDWVTIDRNYAKEHGESALNGEYKIIKRKATAKDLYTNGDSPYEMGYDPVNTKKVEGLLE